jgi:hypothetical protein
MLKLPSVYGVAKARSEMAHMLEEVGKGHNFIITGPRGREALMTSAAAFRAMQEAYLDLVGRVETVKILEDEDAMEALARVFTSGDEERRYTLSEVERMIREDEPNGGEDP